MSRDRYKSTPGPEDNGFRVMLSFHPVIPPPPVSVSVDLCFIMLGMFHKC